MPPSFPPAAPHADPLTALLRDALFSGAPEQVVEPLLMLAGDRAGQARALVDALLAAGGARLLDRVALPYRWHIVLAGLDVLFYDWDPRLRPCLDYALACARADAPAVPPHIRGALAQGLLFAGDAPGALALIPASGGSGDDLAQRALARLQQGDWPGAQAGFEAALRQIRAETGERAGLLGPALAPFYPLALLAQRAPVHLERARRFCQAEAGTRTPAARGRWGLWVHALDAQRGDARLDEAAFALAPEVPPLAQFWRVLLRAWLGDGVPASGRRQPEAERARAVAGLRERLQACGMDWLGRQLDGAVALADGEPVPAHFFAGQRRESWRLALDALQALAGETRAPDGASASRLLWAVTLDADGAVGTIEPLEQARGPRGWNKPRPLPLAKLAEDDRLEPWDARVARAIRRDQSSRRRYVLDRAAAVLALVGHPGVVLAQAPEQTLEVVEGAPTLEVVRDGTRYTLRVSPPLREAPALDSFLPAGGRAEAEALRQITVLREGSQRLRVIRLTPAQQGAAQLIADGLAVPAEAQGQLDATLRALSGHFQVHSDLGGGTRELETESRLRAELAPLGEGLALRLVVTPLGPLGPRLAPGGGRERLMAAVRGESLATQRDLAAELANVAEVFDALPFLVPRAPDSGEYDWTLTDPEEALSVVEALPGLAGVQALEWPRGKEVRVTGADIAQLAVRIETESAWFKLVGELRVAEGLVVQLGELLAWAASHAGRFMPMGQGVYVALTRSLRARLRDLASVAHGARDGIQVPLMAAPWLDDVLAGAGVDPDSHFRERARRLRGARASLAALPANLAAELRPYQEDGYRWAMSLAEAGFGACLADDMGLGKTLQALAVMLARAPGGAALVVAPTSVCGNWAEEARRFAPTLRVHLYGENTAEGERGALLAQAGPFDVVIVTYTLLLQARAAFCQREWHTVVADEAQSFKNAAARRAQAIFALKAGFRMALSGTPVENRLAELWSIMRFCNPGLLGSLARFNEHFAVPVERNGVREAALRLRRMIAPFVLRRTKAQVLDELPPRTELVLRVEPDAVEAAHYEALRRQVLAEAEAAVAAPARGAGKGQLKGQPAPDARIHVLAQLMRLRRAACDARLVTPELDLGNPGQDGAKLRAFVQLAGELAANGHKTLVFSQFVDFLQLLRDGLERAGLAWQYLDGATPAAERTRRVAAFQAGEGDVFLISLKAGGFGLNLTAADYVVIADPWWNPAAEDQAMGRAHRIGQQRPVTVYRLISAGTIEERILTLHHGKRALADGILEAGEEGGAAMDGTAALPDIDELVGLLRR